MEYRLAGKSGNKFYKTNILETIQENIMQEIKSGLI